MITMREMVNGMRLSDLLADKWVPSSVGDTVVSGLCLDHRKLSAGDLFFALRGLRSDGAAFIGDAVDAGAVAVLKNQENADETITWYKHVPVIPYSRLQRDVSVIAGRFYHQPSSAMHVIGITGTNGKTTCAQLLAQLFSRLGEKSGTMGTLGYGIADRDHRLESFTETGMTTADPVTIQSILADMSAANVETLTMEVSSHSLSQYRVSGVSFNTAVFTNLSHDHLDYHGTMSAYGEAKRRLFHVNGLTRAVINRDDNFGDQLIDEISQTVPTTTYSTHNPRADMRAENIEFQSDGMGVTIDSVWGKVRVHTQMIGHFNVSNLLAVIATACARGFALEEVAEQVAALKPAAGRMELIPNDQGVQVVVDYAHTPDGLEKALDSLKQHTPGKLICVFGCGGDRDKAKRPVMAEIAEHHADRVIVTSDNPRFEPMVDILSDIRQGFRQPSGIEFVDDRAFAIEQAIHQAQPGDCVLIAGKGHEDYQLVGENRLPFSDINHARLALRNRDPKSQS